MDYHMRLIAADARLMRMTRRVDNLIHHFGLYYNDRENLQDDEDDARIAAADCLSDALASIRRAKEILEDGV